MTIKQYRKYLADGNKVECYGMNFDLFEHDKVMILNDYNLKVMSSEVLIFYNNFIDLNVQISSAIENLNINHIRIVLDNEKEHTYILELDCRKRDKKVEKDTGISSKMSIQ